MKMKCGWRFLKRMLDKIKIGKKKYCWPWLGNHMKDGRGIVTFRRKKCLAHRMVWAVFHNELPPANMEVCHKCDNPNCCNPHHLFLATHAENMADMAAKGRRKGITAGSRNPNSKLKESQVRSIRRLSAQGCKRKLLAERFGMSKAAIHKIINGTQWRNVN